MAKQIELLFARRFRRVKRGVFGKQDLQLPVVLSKFVELFSCSREGIEQIQLLLRRK